MSEKQPAAERFITDVETIKVFANELRLTLFQLMQEPTTVKVMSEAVKIPAVKLYYHVNLLLKHELIQVVGHNLESGIVEKIYQVTARQIRLINPLLLEERLPQETADFLFNNMLLDTMTDFQRAYQARPAAEGTPPRYPFFSKKQMQLTDAQLTALHNKLDTLIQEVTALGTENSSTDEPVYELTVVFYNKEEPENENQSE